MKDNFQKSCPFCNKLLEIKYKNDLVIEGEIPLQQHRNWIVCPNCKRHLTLTQIIDVELSVVESSTPDLGYYWNRTDTTSGTGFTFAVPYREGQAQL